MRRQNKQGRSKVVDEKLTYPQDSQKIRAYLSVEQLHFCAYTDDRLSATSPGQVEHFDPTQKDSEADGYHNWFVVHGHWNQKKQDKRRWAKYQPILHPSAEDLEQRLILDGADYIYRPDDTEAKNLAKYLFIDDEQLSKERQSYLSRIRFLSKHHDLAWYFEQSPDDLRFSRILIEHFQLDLAALVA